LDREPQVPPPVYPPDEVAYAILHAATHPERDIYVGSMSRIMSSLGKAMPHTADWISENMMVPREVRNEPPRDPDGSLYESHDGGNIYGDHPGFVRPLSVYTRAALHPFITSAATGLAMAAGAAAAAWLLGEHPQRSKNRLPGDWNRRPR
jgi:hypothetical protein